MATFLQHFKDSRLSFPDIADRAGAHRDPGRAQAFLTEKLAAHGVTLSPIPRKKVFAVLKQQKRIDPFTRLVATFLQHFKDSRLSFPDIADRAGAHRDPGRAQAFLTEKLAAHGVTLSPIPRKKVFDVLKQQKRIDPFTRLVEAGRYRSPFGYILVDEFQDISPSRAKLLKALLDRSPGAQLFAVGDDWQAIYRFGGSDIAVMREFGEHFGAFERIDLETTFRFSDRIAGVATDFVLRNPAQIRKRVHAMRRADQPAVHIGLPSAQGLSPLKEALDRIAEDARRRRDIRGAAARPLPASETPKHRRSGKAVSGSPLLLDDRAARRGSRATTRWCSACVAANTGFPPRLPTIRCWTWCCPRPKPIRMPRSGACSTSPSPA